jgi:NitT/TauT family transport system substrate-binding protein
MGGLRARCSALVFLLTTLLAGSAAAETKLSFSLNSRFDGPSAPFLVAIDKGYYKAEGLNVSVEDAPSPITAIDRVASGGYDMGVGDINALMKFRDANPGAPVKAIFIVYNKPPYAVIGRKSRGIAGPKDLEGKKIGAPSDDSSFAQWPIFAQANGIDAEKVQIENVSNPVRVPMLAAGQVDAITSFSFLAFINLKERGVPVNDIVVLIMADHGVTLYGDAIIVNQKFADAHPDAVKGFLRAYIKGLRETAKTPTAAIDSVLKRNDDARKETEIDRFRMAYRDNIATAEVKTQGLGTIDRERFTRAIDQIDGAFKFKTKPKPEDIFDGSYLPSAADRKL